MNLPNNGNHAFFITFAFEKYNIVRTLASFFTRIAGSN